MFVFPQAQINTKIKWSHCSHRCHILDSHINNNHYDRSHNCPGTSYIIEMENIQILIYVSGHFKAATTTFEFPSFIFTVASKPEAIEGETILLHQPHTHRL